MAPDENPPHGVLAALRSLWATGCALLRNRVELFGVELQEQKLRLLRLMILGAVGVFLANLGLVMLTITVIFLAGPEARPLVLVGLTLLYLAAATIVFLILRKEIRSAPLPFGDTISELRKDSECFKAGK
jgi:uncharacterized membrane protein YqjE